MSKIKKPNNIEEEQFLQSISTENNKDEISNIDNNEINTEIEKASLQFEESINNLASDIKPIALLGLTKRFQIREIPAPYKVISVRINKNILKEFEQTLGNLVYPLNNNFQGNPEEENIALSYLINHEGMLDQIMLELRKARIESSINIADHQTLVLKVDEKLNSLHKKLDDKHEENTVSQVSISGDTETKTIPSDISELELQTNRLKTAETNYANFKSLQTAINCENLEIKKPRNGECVYLMIDQELLNQNSTDPNLQKVINEINSIIRSPNFHITSYNGYLTIIGTAERGGSSLASMAGRVYRTVQAKMFLGTGVIKNQDNHFNISGFPKLEQRQTWNKMNEAVYMTQEFESLITDPTNRNSALCTIESRETENNLIKLLNVRPKASLKIGGPDRLIGYEEQLQKLESSLTNHQTKLVIIKGAAGMGKSRLTHEAIKKLPYSIICSLDPSGENTPGYGIMTVAEQILEQIRKTEGLESSPACVALSDYDRLSQMEKIKIAQKSPQEIIQLCKNAIRLMNNGAIPFVLDDLHHTDRFSMGPLLNLMDYHLNHNEGKSIVLLRPEEILTPKALNQFEARTKAVYSRVKSVEKIEVLGLDFINNDEIAHDFVYYTIPEKIRNNRNLGTWYRKLAQIAKTHPFVMKSMMDALNENEENFLIKNDTIQLSPQTEDRFDEIINGNSDLTTYYRERLEKLSEQALTFLQCVALIGGKFDTEQANIIATKISTITGQKGIESTIARLVKGGYLIKTSEDDGNRIWQIQHETTRETIIDSIDKNNLLDFNIKLYNQFNNSETIHPGMKLNIANNIANSSRSPEFSHLFWDQYSSLGIQCIDNAKKSNSIGSGYHYSTIILSKNENSKIQNAIALLEDSNSISTNEIPEAIIKLIIESLFTKAENAMFLGKFEEAQAAIKSLKTIHNNNSELDIDIEKIYKIQFQKEYLLRNSKKMEEILNEMNDKQIEISESFQILAQIKLELRKRNYQESANLFNHYSNKLKKELGNMHPEYIEALRLGAARCPFELFRNEVKKNIDEDIELQPGVVKSRDFHKLMQIKEDLQSLLTAKERNPLIFNKYEELALSEQIGITDAYLGDFESSVQKLNEAWRIANQMEIHEQAARIAKFVGDILTISAITMPDYTDTERIYHSPRKLRQSFERPRLHSALKAYTNQGIASAANIDERNFYNLAMRIQRIRTTGLILISHENEISEQNSVKLLNLKKDLEPIIEQSFNDIELINKLTENYPQNDKVEILYYSSYIGIILNFAKKLNLEIPEKILNLDLFSENNLRTAKLFPENKGFKITSLEEIDRKLDGIDFIEQTNNIEDDSYDLED